MPSLAVPRSDASTVSSSLTDYNLVKRVNLSTNKPNTSDSNDVTLPANTPLSAISNITISEDGSSIVCATDAPEESITLFNPMTTRAKFLYCARSGCSIIRFTRKAIESNCPNNNILVGTSHHPQAAQPSENRPAAFWTSYLRYLSLDDGRYISFFSGHTDAVTSITVNPIDYTFLSASIDGTIRWWDLRSPVACGMIRARDESESGQLFGSENSPFNLTANESAGKILCTHDPSGMVVAVGSGPGLVRLYDMRQLALGPFLDNIKVGSFTADSAPGSPFSNYASFSSLKFSPDGSNLLASLTYSYNFKTPNGPHLSFDNEIVQFDAFDGAQQTRFVGHSADVFALDNFAPYSNSSLYSLMNLPFEASYTPDGSHVLAGSRAGGVHFWNAQSGTAVAIYKSPNLDRAYPNNLDASEGASLTMKPAPITSVQFSPSRNCWLAGDSAGFVNWWGLQQS